MTTALQVIIGKYQSTRKLLCALHLSKCAVGKTWLGRLLDILRDMARYGEIYRDMVSGKAKMAHQCVTILYCHHVWTYGLKSRCLMAMQVQKK
eukprot:6190039-Pleurochrysis_carterae.AAC.3